MNTEKEFLNNQRSYPTALRAAEHGRSAHWASTNGWYLPGNNKSHAAKILHNLVRYSVLLAKEQGVNKKMAFAISYNNGEVDVDESGRIVRDADAPELNYWIRVIANAMGDF